MKTTRTALRWGVPLALALMIGLLAADPADARGRRGRGSRVLVVPRVSVGFPGYWGSPFYYSPFYRSYWGHPYYYGPHGAREGQLNPALAKALGVGALDLNVKPRNAEVFVDGTFVGNARDFDGYPSLLWMDEGEHSVELRKGGYATFEQTFDVQGGVVSGLKLKLLPGAPEPPESAPDAEAVSGLTP